MVVVGVIAVYITILVVSYVFYRFFPWQPGDDYKSRAENLALKCGEYEQEIERLRTREVELLRQNIELRRGDA